MFPRGPLEMTPDTGGGQMSGRRPRAGWGKFWNFCFEMVFLHFGAKVTNVVYHHWFSEGYSKTTDLRLIKFLS